MSEVPNNLSTLFTEGKLLKIFMQEHSDWMLRAPLVDVEPMVGVLTEAGLAHLIAERVLAADEPLAQLKLEAENLRALTRFLDGVEVAARAFVYTGHAVLSRADRIAVQKHFSNAA